MRATEFQWTCENVRAFWAATRQLRAGDAIFRFRGCIKAGWLFACLPAAGTLLRRERAACSDTLLGKWSNCPMKRSVSQLSCKAPYKLEHIWQLELIGLTRYK